jgi:hypothetical protein
MERERNRRAKIGEKISPSRSQLERELALGVLSLTFRASIRSKAARSSRTQSDEIPLQQAQAALRRFEKTDLNCVARLHGVGDALDAFANARLDDIGKKTKPLFDSFDCTK